MPPGDVPSFPGELPSGTLLDGRYEIAHTLGRGGFAFTYKAHDRRTGETVAIKEVFPTNCKRTGRKVEPLTPEAAEVLEHSPRWLHNEAARLREFNAPSIVKVRATFEEHETVYAVMEFIDGDNLEQEARAAGGRLSPSQATSRLRRILHALKVVHDKNVLHRDLKPSNVMRATDGRIVLIDFGAAREDNPSSHAASTMMYTPGYAAPEQRTPGTRKTFATDLFAVGAIGFRLLTGEPPVGAHTHDRDMKALIDAGHSALVRTIGWALEHDSGHRPRNAAMMLDALDGIKRAGRGIFDGPRRRIPRPPSPRPPRPVPKPRRDPWFPRRKPEELSGEARRLAAGARWPVALLAATPALILPFLTGVVYLAAIALLVILSALRNELRALGNRRLTSASALFLLPRLVRRLLGLLVAGVFLLGLGLLFIAVLAGIGAAIAAAYSAVDVLLHGQQLDHASFMPGFRLALPRTIVSVPVVLLLASRMNGERALVGRVATAAAGVTEASVATLWVLGVGVPTLVVLLASCHTWAPFGDYEQALLWIEAHVPLVADVDNAIARVSIESQIHEAVDCSSATRHYGYEIDHVGKRSFLVSVDLDHRAVEQLAQEHATAEAGNAEGQVAIAAEVLGRLDATLSARVRAITLVEGNVANRSSGNVSLSRQVLKMVLPRPYGPVTNGTAAGALAATSVLYADPTLRAAAQRLDEERQRVSALGLCG
ncbi:MAG TPA: serine/threonine-protein kinase [Solirubrobacteraceae bacterium]|jgi:serine/threonine protein kinase|nr:serine/threonine-protein kinase [Solirubrobacteraceae bacterium]